MNMYIGIQRISHHTLLAMHNQYAVEECDEMPPQMCYHGVAGSKRYGHYFVRDSKHSFYVLRIPSSSPYLRNNG